MKHAFEVVRLVSLAVILGGFLVLGDAEEAHARKLRHDLSLSRLSLGPRRILRPGPPMRRGLRDLLPSVPGRMRPPSHTPVQPHLGGLCSRS